MSILRTGSRGSEVKLLQAMLNRRYEPRPKLAVDGIYGPKTESAVRGPRVRSGFMNFKPMHEARPDPVDSEARPDPH